MRPWKAFLDIRCGIDSGIPVCCIAWFIGPWCWVCLRVPYFHALSARGFEHIPCPLCLVRNRPVNVQETPFPDDPLTRLIAWLDSV